MTDNRIEVRQGENEWEARIWDNNQLLCPFTPTPFMLHCPRARVENSLKEINPNHTIVFMEKWAEEYKSMVLRIEKVESDEALKKVTKSLERLWGNGIFTIKQFQALSKRIIDKIASLADEL